MCCRRGDVTTVLFQFQLVIAMVHVQVQKHGGTIELCIISSSVGITVCARGMVLLDSLISTFNRISLTDCFRVISTGETQLVGLFTFP